MLRAAHRGSVGHPFMLTGSGGRFCESRLMHFGAWKLSGRSRHGSLKGEPFAHLCWSHVFFARIVESQVPAALFLASLDRSRWHEFGSPFVSMASLTFLEILRAHNFARLTFPGRWFQRSCRENAFDFFLTIPTVIRVSGPQSLFFWTKRHWPNPLVARVAHDVPGKAWSRKYRLQMGGLHENWRKHCLFLGS